MSLDGAARGTHAVLHPVDPGRRIRQTGTLSRLMGYVVTREGVSMRRRRSSAVMD